ncbi:MAG: hypothetical protein WD049_10375 [Candidatus Paceibacterota bacterium]
MADQEQQQLAEYVSALPESVRAVVLSPDTPATIRQVARASGVAEERLTDVVDQTMYTLMGVSPMSRFTKSLESEAGVPGEIAARLASSLGEIVFRDPRANTFLKEMDTSDGRRGGRSGAAESPRDAARNALSSSRRGSDRQSDGARSAPAPRDLPGAERGAEEGSLGGSERGGRAMPRTQAPRPQAKRPPAPATPPSVWDDDEPVAGGADNAARSVPQKPSSANQRIEGFDSFQETDHDHHNLSRGEVLAGIEDPNGEHGPRDVVADGEIEQDSPETNDPDERYGEVEDPYREPIS